MKKALRIVLLLVVTVGLVSACTCTRMRNSAKWSRGAERVTVEATNDMTIFPSTVWHLYPGYTRQPTLKCYYTVENDGTVRQFGDAAKTVEFNAE